MGIETRIIKIAGKTREVRIITDSVYKYEVQIIEGDMDIRGVGDTLQVAIARAEVALKQYERNAFFGCQK